MVAPPPSLIAIPPLHDELRRHVYLTAEGIEAKVKIKKAGGKFTQWYNAHGQWQANKPEGFPVLPYVSKNLNPSDAELTGDEIYWPEGEKDVETLDKLNLPAFTFGGVTDKIDIDAVSIAGKRVVVLADNDSHGGPEHARKKALLAVGAVNVKVVTFEQKDVSDFIAAGRDAEALRSYVDAVAWNSAPPVAAKEPEAAKPTTTWRSLPWLDMSKWDAEPVPQRDWIIFNRVPAEQFGIFSGEGGIGKSIIELTKDVAHVTGKDWLGSLPEIGPVIYLGAEDRTKELHIRMAAITAYFGVTFAEIVAAGLHILPIVDEDATLCTVSRAGTIEPTPLYRLLLEAAGDLKPINISIDPLTSVFAGNEIDRVQVYAFRRQPSRKPRRQSSAAGISTRQ
jgi:hypothetical protein